MKLIEDRENGTRRVAKSFKGLKSLAKQSEKKNCDVNVIVARYQKTGLLVQDLEMASRRQVFGNFENAPDYHSALCAVAKANSAFNALPADLRKRFNHDTGAYIDFVMDPKNTKECIELGLLPKDRSAVRYVDRVSGKVTNILGQVIGHLDEKGDIVEDTPAVAPAGGAPAGQTPIA